VILRKKRRQGGRKESPKLNKQQTIRRESENKETLKMLFRSCKYGSSDKALMWQAQVP
jgi:hypothetical protein